MKHCVKLSGSRQRTVYVLATKVNYLLFSKGNFLYKIRENIFLKNAMSFEIFL